MERDSAKFLYRSLKPLRTKVLRTVSRERTAINHRLLLDLSRDNGAPRFQIYIDILIDILISGRAQNIVIIVQVIVHAVFFK